MHKSKTAVRKAHFLLASMTSLVIAGCGGSSGSQEPAPPTTVGQLKVSTTTPGDASNSANRNGPIEVVFDRELNPSTISSEKVVLQNPIGSIAANVTVAGNKLTLTLPQRLARGATYSIDAVGLQGKSGETLSGTRLLSFTTTTEREWSVPLQIDATGNSSKPHISFDSNGNAVAAWRQNDGANGAIYFNKYTRGLGWSSPGALQVASGDVGYIQLAHIDDNHVLAVWPRFDACCFGIYSSQYTVGGGWDTPQRIYEGMRVFGEFNVSDPISVSTDQAGKAFVVWSDFTGMNTTARSRIYTLSGGWGPLTTVDSFQSYMDRANVSMNKRGQAFATYTTTNLPYGDSGTKVRAKQYTQDGKWATVLLFSTEFIEARFPRVATDDAGNATFVWLQSDATAKSIHAHRFSATGPLDTDTVLSNDSGDALPPKLVVDSAGNVSVVWGQNIDGKVQLYTNRYSIGGWQTAQAIAADIKYSGTDSPQIATDKDGNVLVVWLQSDDSKINVYSRRFVPAQGWEEAKIQSTTGNASNPQIVFSSPGDAMIVWESHEGTASKILVTAFD